MAFTIKDWQNLPSTTTPISAEALEDMETRLSAYSDTITAVVQADLNNVRVKADTNTQTGTTYTLVLADAGKIVEMNNAAANTLTVPPNSTVAFIIGTIIEVCQVGAGITSVAAGAGVTFRPTTPIAVSAQWESLRLRKRATNEWVIE